MKKTLLLFTLLLGIFSSSTLIAQDSDLLNKVRANVNAKSIKGKTPLSLAEEGSYVEIVEILKASGAK